MRLPSNLIGQPDGIIGDVGEWMKVYESGLMAKGWVVWREQERQSIDEWYDAREVQTPAAYVAEPRLPSWMRRARAAFSRDIN